MKKNDPIIAKVMMNAIRLAPIDCLERKRAKSTIGARERSSIATKTAGPRPTHERATISATPSGIALDQGEHDRRRACREQRRGVVDAVVHRLVARLCHRDTVAAIAAAATEG
jgi:hypothetical protein